jgi:hypothetical protein
MPSRCTEAQRITSEEPAKQTDKTLHDFDYAALESCGTLPGSIIGPFLRKIHEGIRIREQERTITPANAMFDENNQLFLF